MRQINQREQTSWYYTTNCCYNRTESVFMFKSKVYLKMANCEYKRLFLIGGLRGCAWPSLRREWESRENLYGFVRHSTCRLDISVKEALEHSRQSFWVRANAILFDSKKGALPYIELVVQLRERKIFKSLFLLISTRVNLFKNEDQYWVKCNW